jgi:Icc-related predicted phosphoesterase
MENNKKLKILAAGDLHGSEIIAERLAIKAKRENVDLVILAGDISSPFKKEKVLGHFKERGLETVFVPGNWDSDLDVRFMEDMYSMTNLEGYYFSKGRIDFLGIGSSGFKLNHDIEKDFPKLEKKFKSLEGKTRKKVLVSHLHVAGSKAEFSGFRGSYVLRKIIEELEPDLIISSHIHEAEGIEEKIKKTKIIQVGPRGKILKI